MEDITMLGELLPRFITEILVAIVCGGLIGLEESLQHKSTGLRDNILICLGAVVYMIISEIIALNAPEGVVSDPARIAAQVVTGVGFIGAGVIIHKGRDITGLTTAATIWVVAAIGLTIGAGYPLLGMLITGVTLLTLTLLQEIDKHLIKKPRTLLLKLTLRDDNPDFRKSLQEMLEKHSVKPEGYRSERGSFGVRMTVRAPEEPQDIRLLVADLWTLPGVTEVEH